MEPNPDPIQYAIFQIKDQKDPKNRIPYMIPINPHLSLHHATYQLYSQAKIPLSFLEKIYYINRIVHKRYSLHIVEKSGLTSFFPVQLTDSLNLTLEKLYSKRDLKDCRDHQTQLLFRISFGDHLDPDPDHIRTILDIQYDFYRVMMVIAIIVLKMFHSSGYRITREMAMILLFASLYHILLINYMFYYYARRQVDPLFCDLIHRLYGDLSLIDVDLKRSIKWLDQSIQRMGRWLYDRLIRTPISHITDQLLHRFLSTK